MKPSREQGRVEPRAVVIQRSQRIFLALIRKLAICELGVPLDVLVAEGPVAHLSYAVAFTVACYPVNHSLD